MATHSPILMALPNAKLLYLDNGEFIGTSYRDTPHYAVTRAFLEAPDRYLEELSKKL
jgi:predicted ATPase